MELDRSGCGLLVVLMGVWSILVALCPFSGQLVSSPLPEAQTVVSSASSLDILNPPISPEYYFENRGDYPPELVYYIAWTLFAEINLPALAGQRGVPDPNQPFGAPGPTVWETWKGMDEVYLSDGSVPAAWDSPLPPKLLTETQMIDGQTFTSVSSGDDVYYEVRMNEDTFNYIVQRTLYNRDGQNAFFVDPAAVPVIFPEPSFEVKASWIVLGTGDDPSDYHTAPGYILDGSGNQVAVTFGLTGFHFTSKTIPQWFWATFENVNNQTATNAEPPLQPIPAIVQVVNNDVHQQLGPDNVWSNYVLRGIQVGFEQPVDLLANTQIETYFQGSSSCITCHSLSSIGSTTDGRMPFFNVDASGSQGWYGDPSTITFTDALGENFFYCGLAASVPCGSQFGASCNVQNGFVDSECNLRFKQLDFLWSMRRAQWQGSSQ